VHSVSLAFGLGDAYNKDNTTEVHVHPDLLKFVHQYYTVYKSYKSYTEYKY